MSSVTIKVDQGGHPAGVPGQAREDLATGSDVTVTAGGGPFFAYLWSFVSKPVDVISNVRASSMFISPSATASVIHPIDVEGTYEVEVQVDSGSGLGALSTDVARMTFYAGTTIAVRADYLPQREPAFGEKNEHNVPDLIDPLGNIDGWARTLGRWFAVIRTIYRAKSWARARVALTGGGATVTRGTNIAGVTRTSLGTVDVTFIRAMGDGNYSVTATARTTAGQCVVSGESTTGFTISRLDVGGSLVDADFNFDVGLGT